MPVIADLYIQDFPEVAEQRDKIIITLMKEEKAFARTLLKGTKHLLSFIADGLTGQEIFTMHDTYGFSYELSVEIAKRHHIQLAAD